MASGARSREQVRLNLDVPFKKTVAPDNLGKLIVEIVKYILYEREQLPTPYDAFKRSTRNIAGDCNSANKSKPMNPTGIVKQHKALASIEGMDLIFTCAQQLVQGNKLAQILLVFGPTVMSPIESYVIRVPERNLTCRSCGDTSGFQRCMLQVLETFRTVSQMNGNGSSTKLRTFLCLRRCDVEPGLMDVRPRFQVPCKGRLTVLNLSLPSCCHNDASSIDAASVACENGGGTTAPSRDNAESSKEISRTRCGDASGDQDWVWAQCKPVFVTVLGCTSSNEPLTCL